MTVPDEDGKFVDDTIVEDTPIDAYAIGKLQRVRGTTIILEWKS